MSDGDIDPRLKSLGSLIRLQDDAQSAETLPALTFVIVNGTYQVIRYDRAVLVIGRSGPSGRVAAVSAVPIIEKSSAIAVWYRRLWTHACSKPGERVITHDELPKDLREQAGEYAGKNLLYLPLISSQVGLVGGLFLSRNAGWNEGEVSLCARLSRSYGHALGAQRRPWRRTWLSNQGVWKWGVRSAVLASLIACVFIRVPFSVLGDAEVVARDPVPITAALGGVIKDIYVQDGDQVKQGDLLGVFDQTELRNRENLALRTLEVARAEFGSVRQQAFNDQRGRAGLEALAAKVREREVELSFTQELLTKTEMRAPVDGVIVLDNRDALIGHPIRLGESVLIIADPNDVEVQVWVGVDDAVTLQEDARVQFFLNIDPLVPREGRLVRAAFRAQLSPSNVLSYDTRVKVEPDQEILRIGLRGTGKIYGGDVTLGYLIFRRPLSYLRRTLGY